MSDTGANPVTTVQGLEVNTLADGVFHLATMALLALGVIGLITAWRRGHPAASPLFHLGLVPAGREIFDVVKGTVDHLLLEVHHVRDDLGGPTSWDVGFLLFGALLVLVGAALHRAGDHSA